MFKAPQINGINPKKGNSSFGSNPFFTAQTKLSVGKADDAYEKEADAVADKIVQKSEGKTPENTFFPPAAIQKKSQENDVEELQKKTNSRFHYSSFTVKGIGGRNAPKEM